MTGPLQFVREYQAASCNHFIISWQRPKKKPSATHARPALRKPRVTEDGGQKEDLKKIVATQIESRARPSAQPAVSHVRLQEQADHKATRTIPNLTVHVRRRSCTSPHTRKQSVRVTRKVLRLRVRTQLVEYVGR